MREGRASGTITVLFTDLVGSTDLMSRLDAEAFDRLRRAHFAALREAVGRAGGEEVKSTGDGIMATFGSVADAVRCAVAMQQATHRQASRGAVPVAIRVGLSVGDVTFEDGDVFGAPVVEAARLVAAAGPSEILTTQIARALAGRADAQFVDVGTLQLQGLPDPVPACRVLWEPLAEASIPMPALLTDVGRIFVGRDAELERLGQLWKEAAAGERRVALLAGEPGVGKTRLAAEMAAKVHDEGGTVLAGRCDEDLGVPYQPFVEALRHFVDHTPADRLRERLGRYGGELARLVPELDERVPGLPSALRSDPETERYRLFDSVGAWLSAVSADDPLVLVLDDLQWAAKPTLLLLRHVVRFLDAKRVLVLGTYRDTELTHNHPLVEVVADLRREGGLERVSLSGLDDLGVAAIVEQAAGQTLDEEGVALARAIHQETEGNPFFVREVLRHLAETGAVERRAGRWAARLSLEELGIPEGVREVVARRVARLSEQANRLLQVAAVVGAEFELPVLQQAEGIDDEDFVSAVEESTRARLVIENADGGGRYRFAHALVRDTLYDNLSGARRVAVHRRIAEAIELLHADDLADDLPALAHHWAKACIGGADPARAIDYAARAGDRALAQFAHDEAATYYAQALDLLDATRTVAHEPMRVELLISLGEAERRAGDLSHRQTLLTAAQLAKKQGDVYALARAALANSRGILMSSFVVDSERVVALEAALETVPDADTALRGHLKANLALELAYAREREHRVQLSDEALALARQSGDTSTLAHVLATRFYAIAAPETLPERLANSVELIALAARLDDPLARGQAFSIRYRTAMESADIEEADRSLRAYEDLAETLQQPTLRWFATVNRAGQAMLAGDLVRAERLVHDGLDLGHAAGQPDAELWFLYQLYQIRLEQGRLAEHEKRFAEAAGRSPRLSFFQPALVYMYCELGRDDEAKDAFHRLAEVGFDFPLDVDWTKCMTDAASACARLSDVAAASVLWRLLAPHANQVVFMGGFVNGVISHHLAALATVRGCFDEAETHFAGAEATHERIGAPTWLARTRLEWARMLLTRRRPGDADWARELLGQTLATARGLGLANVERRAVALLQDCP